MSIAKENKVVRGLDISRIGAVIKTALAKKGNAKIFYGTCSTAAGTVEKEVVCPDFTADDLVKGAAILVTFDYTSSAAVASVTMNVNSTGAHRVQKIYNNAYANLTHAGDLRAGMTHLFVFTGSAWVVSGLDYNANTTYNQAVLYRNAGRFVADSAVYRYQILLSVDRDTLTPLNNVSNNTGTSKAMLTDVEFDPFGDIYLYNYTTSFAAGAYISATYLAYAFPDINLAYTFNISSSVNALTADQDVYMKVSPQSSGKVKMASDFPLTQILPSTDDGYLYIFLGRASSESRMTLYPDHPVYYHDGTSLKELPNPRLAAWVKSQGETIFWKKTDVDAAPFRGSTNLVTSGGVWEGILDSPGYFEMEPITATSTSFNLEVTPGFVYKYTINDGVTVSFLLNNPDYAVLEYYHWIFDTGSTAPTITWPSAIKEWAGGSAPTIVANKRYEVSVLKGVAVVLETDIPSTT